MCAEMFLSPSGKASSLSLDIIPSLGVMIKISFSIPYSD